MCKHYKTPVLLVEFEGDKAFALQVCMGVRAFGCVCVVRDALLSCRARLPAANACLGRP